MVARYIMLLQAPEDARYLERSSGAWFDECFLPGPSGPGLKIGAPLEHISKDV